MEAGHDLSTVENEKRHLARISNPYFSGILANFHDKNVTPVTFFKGMSGMWRKLTTAGATRFSKSSEGIVLEEIYIE
jgi:hypothetical protein